MGPISAASAAVSQPTHIARRRSINGAYGCERSGAKRLPWRTVKPCCAARLDLGREPRLADAGLTREQGDAARPRRRLSQAPHDGGKLPLSPHKRRPLAKLRHRLLRSGDQVQTTAARTRRAGGVRAAASARARPAISCARMHRGRGACAAREPVAPIGAVGGDGEARTGMPRLGCFGW